MSKFERLRRKSVYIYRGSNGSHAMAIMSKAVGPARAVAEYLRDQGVDVADDLRDEVTRFFARALGYPKGFLPGATLADRLSHLLTMPRLAANHFTPFEHVLYEPDAQINSPNTARLLESISKDPKTSILYALGVVPDSLQSGGPIQYFRGSPNASPFVAVVAPTSDPDLANIGQLGNIATGPGLTPEEAGRRVLRDQEVLLRDAVAPFKLVHLQPLTSSDPKKILDEAAEILVKAGVAEYAPSPKATKGAKARRNTRAKGNTRTAKVKAKVPARPAKRTSKKPTRTSKASKSPKKKRTR